MRRFITTAAALVALPLAAALADDTASSAEQATQAQAATLGVGDTAPPLRIGDWVKGSAVPSFEKGKFYVVEFWATWCRPCIAGMPHLSSLQSEYADQGLTIIGVTSDGPNNSVEQIEAMVAAKGEVMSYTVALDDGLTTSEAYMKAARRRSLPSSFVVDRDGKIAWIGHPMWLDIPLAGIAAGTWDPKSGPAQVETAKQRLADVYQTLPTDPGAALDKYDAFATDFPKVIAQLKNQRFTLAVRAGRSSVSSAEGEKLIRDAISGKDAMKLNELAWTLVDPATPLQDRHLDLALEAASAANALTGGKDGAILDTLARVYHWRGNGKKALTLQTRAVELAAGTNMEQGLRAALEEYQAAQAK